MRKHFIFGLLLVLVIGMGVYVHIQVTQMGEQAQMCENLTIFDDISELDFLQPYETERLQPEMPPHAVAAYCAKINYKGNDYTVTAYVFDSADAAVVQLWGMVIDPYLSANYSTVISQVTNTGELSAINGCNFYQVNGNGRKDFCEFVEFMCANMHTPVQT